MGCACCTPATEAVESPWVGKTASEVRGPRGHSVSASTKPQEVRDEQLSAILLLLEGRVGYANNIGNRLYNAMDFVNGSQPETDGVCKTGPLPVVGGILADIHSRLSQLVSALDFIDRGVIRVERIVG